MRFLAIAVLSVGSGVVGAWWCDRHNIPTKVGFPLMWISVALGVAIGMCCYAIAFGP